MTYALMLIMAESLIIIAVVLRHLLKLILNVSFATVRYDIKYLAILIRALLIILSKYLN